MRPATEQTESDREHESLNLDRALLQAMIAEPDATQDAWAKAVGRAKSRVNGRLQRLQKDKLVEKVLGKWTVTTKGKKALE